MFPTAFLLFGILTLGNALDPIADQEQRCKIGGAPDGFQTVDMNWLSSISVFYYPIWNKFEMWKFCEDGHGEKFCRSKSPQELLQLGCSYWVPPSNASYFGKPITYDSITTETDIFCRKRGEYEIPFRRHHYVLSDNRSFVLGTKCYEGGDLSWLVLSPFKTLPHATLQKIVLHVESLGFNKQNIVYNPPNYCEEYEHPHYYPGVQDQQVDGYNGGNYGYYERE